MIVVHHPSCGALEGGGWGVACLLDFHPNSAKSGEVGVEGSVNLKPELFAYFV